MCIKTEAKNVILEMLHFFYEKPQVLLALIGIIPAWILYNDLRSFSTNQTAVLIEVKEVLKEMNMRIDNLEKKQKQ